MKAAQDLRGRLFSSKTLFFHTMKSAQKILSILRHIFGWAPALIAIPVQLELNLPVHGSAFCEPCVCLRPRQRQSLFDSSMDKKKIEGRTVFDLPGMRLCSPITTERN